AIESTQGQTQDLFRVGTSSNATLPTTTDASYFSVSAYGNTTITGKVLNPTLAGSYATSTYGIAVRGDYAYVVKRDGGATNVHFVIFDVSDPANPVVVSTAVNQGTAYSDLRSGIAVEGNFAYVGNFGSGFISVYDISKPKSPQWVAELSNGNLARIMDMKIRGKYLYASTYDGDGIAIVDISNPYLPVFVTEFEPGGQRIINMFDISGNYLYAPDALLDSLLIIDITNPASPVLLDEFQPGGLNGNLNGVTSVAVQGKLAYILGNNLLSVVDVSDPYNPVLVKQTGSGILNTSLDIKLSGRYAYIGNLSASAAHGLTIFDLASS
ncbi:MAG: hypothetical protein COU22_01540, partial [Candidatus Komeilibacteria bacterium CG10_big_fil_rev_8_21_14_0_10_41_13]